MYIDHFRVSSEYMNTISTFVKLNFSSIVFGPPTLFRNLHIQRVLKYLELEKSNLNETIISVQLIKLMISLHILDGIKIKSIRYIFWDWQALYVLM